jgi:DNA invertase Pin-like site-specific DNA recombinase
MPSRGDRAELQRLLKRLFPGYVLVVTRLDRLARSTRDLLNVLDAVIERDTGNTTTPHGRLMLTVLGDLAELERELIRASTREGRERAKTRGCASAGRRNLPLTSVARPLRGLMPVPVANDYGWLSPTHSDGAFL